jgi:AbiU2
MNRQESTDWLKIIHRNVSDLYIINELFWQFHGVLSENARLAASNNIFFHWINSLFSESIVMRVRREVDTGHDCVSILTMLRRLRENPAILNGRITEAELSNDIDALSGRASDIVEAAPAIIVRGYADRRVAHADQRTLHDGNPTFRHVWECIGQLCVLVNKYRVASDEELSTLPRACGTGWKEVLTFPWIDQYPPRLNPPVLAPRGHNPIFRSHVLVHLSLKFLDQRKNLLQLCFGFERVSGVPLVDIPERHAHHRHHILPGDTRRRHAYRGRSVAERVSDSPNHIAKARPRLASGHDPRALKAPTRGACCG